MSREGGVHQLPGESLVPGGIPGEAEIGAAGVGGGIVDSAIGVDLEHVGSAIGRDPEVAAAADRRLELADGRAVE